MKQRLLLPMLVALVGFCSPAAAQQPALPAPPPQAGLPAPNASDTREALQVILELYPYTVAEVLRRDPSLMARPDYMATYPQLAKFLGFRALAERRSCQRDRWRTGAKHDRRRDRRGAAGAGAARVVFRVV